MCLCQPESGLRDTFWPKTCLCQPERCLRAPPTVPLGPAPGPQGTFKPVFVPLGPAPGPQGSLRPVRASPPSSPSRNPGRAAHFHPLTVVPVPNPRTGTTLQPSQPPTGPGQNSLLPHPLHRNPAQTPSNCSIAASTSPGSSVRIPASKFRVRALFIPSPAPVKFADPI